MKRSTLDSYFPSSIVLAPDSAPGLSVTGDAALDSAVMSRLNLNMEPAAGEKAAATKAEAGETPAARLERETAAAEATRIAGLVEATGKTAEEILAEEVAGLTAKNAQSAEERAAKITALVESGKTAEEAEAEVAAEEAAAAVAVQTPELTPEVQTWHEAQMAAKDEELTTLRTEAEAATAKVTELTAQLESAGAQPLAIAPIDPLFLIDDPAQLDVEAGKLKEFEAWLQQNWEGVEPVEASADGKTKAVAGFTAAQIRARYAQVQELRNEILPAAREGIKTRKVYEAQARKAYPELFDPKRPEFKVVERVLKMAPGLKAVIQNIHTVIGDSLRGEKLRLAEEKARATKKVTATTRIPPKVIKPGGGPATVRSPQPGVQGKKSDVVNTDKFSKAMEAGATGRNALIASMS